MAKYRYTSVVEQDEDGAFIAWCPAIQGCYTQGDTYEEAVTNLGDAIQLHLEARRDSGDPIPVEIAIDQIEVSV